MNDPLGGLPQQHPPPGGPPREPEAEQPPFRSPPSTVTIVLLALIGLGFLAEGWLSNWTSFQDDEALLRLGSLFAPAVRAGDWWRLGSYAFLHIGVPHLVMNSWALWVLMRPVEGAYGSAAAIGLFAASTIAGGAASCTASLLAESSVQAAGASGGIFGLFGATGALWIRLRHRVPPEALRAAGRAFVINLVLNAVIALMAPVDNWAHAGGFVAGLLLGLLAPLPIEERKAHHSLAQIALVCAALALAAAEGAAVARAVDPHPHRFVAPGVEAKLPWYAAPVAPGIFGTPAGLGLRGAVGHWNGPELDDKPVAIVGDRKFRSWQGKPQEEQLRNCPHAAQLVSMDAEPLYVVVCCWRRACEGKQTQQLAQAVASSARSTR